MSVITIIPYSPEYQPDFKRLNVAWISQYFTLETHDLEQLDQPERFILLNNGQIFLAQVEGNIAGTVAMVLDKADAASYELAKMAVDPVVQGKGIARMLGETALDFARQQGASRVWLESNRVLTPALTLYEKLGFREVPSRPTPYSRANIRMEIQL